MEKHGRVAPCQSSSRRTLVFPWSTTPKKWRIRDAHTVTRCRSATYRCLVATALWLALEGLCSFWDSRRSQPGRQSPLHLAHQFQRYLSHRFSACSPPHSMAIGPCHQEKFIKHSVVNRGGLLTEDSQVSIPLLRLSLSRVENRTNKVLIEA
jgi:hypothetical protein